MPKMCLLRTITYGESSEFVREKQTYNVLHNVKLKIMSTNQNMFLLIASIQHTHHCAQEGGMFRPRHTTHVPRFIFQVWSGVWWWCVSTE